MVLGKHKRESSGAELQARPGPKLLPVEEALTKAGKDEREYDNFAFLDIGYALTAKSRYTTAEFVEFAIFVRLLQGEDRGCLTRPIPHRTVEPLQFGKPTRSVTSGDQRSRLVDTSLPPLHDIDEIFHHITTVAKPQLDPALNRLQTSNIPTLRVATMCSGTEAPLLALKLMQQFISTDYKTPLNFNHLFSAEIEAWKQAYIERNFKPPVLFRDVCELGQPSRKCMTAYGSLVEVPGGVDILVAGAACVDFSSLNNHKPVDGESKDTMNAIIAYASRAKPTIVILENVAGAPWSSFANDWKNAGYATEWTTLDTKHYYIPHTRVRGYMICIVAEYADQQTLKQLKHFKDAMKNFERQASSPVDAFLLPENDPRTINGLAEMSSSGRGQNAKTRKVEWAACQGEYRRYRDCEQIGRLRPYTMWTESGKTRYPDYSCKPWGEAQVERVHDTLDIAFLRNLAKGFDHHFKSRVLELSQSANRVKDSQQFGIAGCMTPTGMPFSTYRGRPILGVESLALQGIPIDELSLNKESQRNLQDLAGNAMTATVVGLTIIFALSIGTGALINARHTQPWRFLEKMTLESRRLSLRQKLEPLVYPPLNPNVGKFKFDGRSDIQFTLEEANITRSFCYCEKGLAVTQRRLQQCSACGHTTCVKCGGNPKHMYQPLRLRRDESAVFKFVHDVLGALPKRCSIVGLTMSDFEERIPKESNEKLWEKYLTAIKPAVDGEELRYSSFKRSHCWKISYDAQHTRMDVVIDKNMTTWFVYAKPSADEPGVSDIRSLLSKPFLRMRNPNRPNDLNGVWQLNIPTLREFKLQITGNGSQLPLYEARLGLQLPEIATKKVWTELQVDPVGNFPQLEADIFGTYTLLPECGTALGCLHKKLDSNDQRPLYLFLSPQPLTLPENDSFIFSYSKDLLDFGEQHHEIAQLQSGWRPNSTKLQVVKCFIKNNWIDMKHVHISTLDYASSFNHCEFPSQLSEMNVVHAPCSLQDLSWYLSLVSCKVAAPVTGTREDWQYMIPNKAPKFFSQFTWLTESLPTPPFLADWNHFSLSPSAPCLISTSSSHRGKIELSRCVTCSPLKPRVSWQIIRKKGQEEIVPFENTEDAAAFERALKERPLPFMSRYRFNHEDGCIDFSVAVNLHTLIHRAAGKLRDNSFKVRNSAPQHAITAAWKRRGAKLEKERSVLETQIWILKDQNDRQAAQPDAQNLKAINDLQKRLLRCHDPWEDSIRISWRLLTRLNLSIPDSNLEFSIPNNVCDEISPPSPNFSARFPLRTDQARSLTWMKQMENNPLPFPEEETEEVGIPALSWRIETRVLKEKYVRGGVLADRVGYGKTAIILALIDAQREIDHDRVKKIKQFDDNFNNATDEYLRLRMMTSRIVVKATLILVPDSLVEQWSDEVKKFLPGRHNVVMLKTAASLRNKNVAEIEDADIIIVAFRVLKGMEYVKRLAELTALWSGDGLTGRHFAAWYQETTRRIDKYMKKLRENGPKSLNDLLSKDRDLNAKNPKLTEFVPPSKRLKGAKYRNMKGKGPKGAAQSPVADGKDAIGLENFEIPRCFNFENAKTYRQVKNPLFEMFYFSRIVVDEFSYLPEMKELPIMLPHLQAHSKWILSGTPPLENWKDVHSFAQLLGVYIGAEDISHNWRDQKANSDSQTFKALSEIHSRGWHSARHRKAQEFLNHFTRANTPDIDPIYKEEIIHAFHLPPAERTVYLELQHSVVASGMKYREQMASNDRVYTAKGLLTLSGTPEGVLVAASSFFDAERYRRVDENSVDPNYLCQRLLYRRSVEVQDALIAFGNDMKVVTGLYKNITDTTSKYGLAEAIDERRFRDLKDELVKNDFGDLSVVRVCEEVCAKIEEEIFGSSEISHKHKKSRLAEMMQNAQREPSKRVMDSLKQDRSRLRELVMKARKIVDSIVAKRRAFRSAMIVHRFQEVGSMTETDAPLEPKTLCDRPRCRKELTIQDAYVSTFCGHIFCHDCFILNDEAEVCGAEGCNATGEAKYSEKMEHMRIGAEKELHTNVKTDCGEKVRRVIQLIKEVIPKEDRALLFVQNDNMIRKVHRALVNAGIESENLVMDDDDAKSKKTEISKIIANVQKKESTTKVLILNPFDITAAGANLTHANHVIFFAPLLAETAKEYITKMSQSIGRCQRFGQEKLVKIHYFLALRTIDVSILQYRTNKHLVRVEKSQELNLHGGDRDHSQKQGQGHVHARWLMLTEDEIEDNADVLGNQSLQDWGGEALNEYYANA